MSEIQGEENFQQYCPNCGRSIIRIPISAEKAKIKHYAFGDFTKFQLGSKFNPYTGLRQYGIRVMCPNAKWWNYCTDYVDENSLHDSDLPELLKL